MKFLSLLTLLFFVSCTSIKDKENASDILDIKEVYIQNWIGGVPQEGSGIYFHLILNKPLSTSLVLEKLRIESSEVPIIKESATVYKAKIINPQNDLILDKNPQNEYKNQIPIKSLKPNEAYLLFKSNEKTYAKHLQNIKEKPMIAYPFKNKPKN